MFIFLNNCFSTPVINIRWSQEERTTDKGFNACVNAISLILSDILMKSPSEDESYDLLDRILDEIRETTEEKLLKYFKSDESQESRKAFADILSTWPADQNHQKSDVLDRIIQGFYHDEA